MTTILHLSDPHFGTDVPDVAKALRDLVSTLSPELLILSGDITQRARASQFAAAAKFVRELSVPHLVSVPGNHDIPLFDVARRLFAPYARYRNHFGDDLEPSFHAPDCLVVSVNSTRPHRHVNGEISGEQCERVAQQLRGAVANQLRLVVLHHPVATPRHSEQVNVAHGSEMAIRIWSEAGADLVLAGHIHLPFVLPIHEVAQLAKPLWALNAGTALSTRTRHDAGNSVNVIQTIAEEPRSCVVEHWTFQSTKHSFQREARMRLIVSS